MLDLIHEAWAAPNMPRPSVYSCNAAIAACARVGRLQEAMTLFKDMVRSPCSPTAAVTLYLPWQKFAPPSCTLALINEAIDGSTSCIIY